MKQFLFGVLATALMFTAVSSPAEATTQASWTPTSKSQKSTQTRATHRQVEASSAKNKCRKDVGITGFATLAGVRLEKAKVRVFVPGKNDKLGEFSKEMWLNGSAWTNDMGGFLVAVDCLPKTYVVKVSSGLLRGRKNHQTISALGIRSESAVIITPATSIAVKYARQHHVKANVAVKRVTKYLKTVKLSNEVVSLGSATWVRAARFDPTRYLSKAIRAGGVQKFATKLARDIKGKHHRTFKPKDYRKSVRPGYPRAGVAGSPRTPRKHLRAATRGSSPTSILYSVAGKAAFDTTCALLPPAPPTNMACASPGSDEVENQLTAISDQLATLQTSVNDIIDQLDSMQNQLNTIQDELQEVIEQESDEIQLQLLNEAQSAQQDYQDAYGYAGVSQIQDLVTAATNDLAVLGAFVPSSKWRAVPVGSSNDVICGTMYSQYDSTSGSNPLNSCANFLGEVQAFSDPSTAYYASLYSSLVGQAGLPQDDLIVWTNQEALVYGGTLPVPSSTLADLQANAGQLGALMDNAYALLAAGQWFIYGATTGNSATSCPDLTTSGSFPANTPISVADACSTLETGLFAAAVQNNLAVSVAVPPAETVADPRTNYVWWSYPVDLTGATFASGAFPYWPGAASGTYTSTAGKPGPLYIFTTAFNPACCTAEVLYSTYQPTPPLLAASPSYTFTLANQAENQTLFNNLLLSSTNGATATVAQSLEADGFFGIGQNSYGMDWINLGVDPAISQVTTSLQWQSTNAMSATATACTGYPPTSPDSFTCSPVPTSTGVAKGMQMLGGTFASNQWNLDVTQLPDTSTLVPCPVVGNTTYAGTNQYFNVAVCEEDTFGLLVDTAAGAGSGTNVLPPFWSPAMFAGPPAGGVPAGAVPQPTPVTASD